MTILGVDPGVARVGYGLVKKTSNNNLKLIDYNCIETDKELPIAQRLSQIDKQLKKIIKENKPEQVAVEDIFFFKNLKTVIAVSQARGVILARAAKMRIPVIEYTPLQIKQAVTSYGRADKTQVQKMVKLLLKLKQIPKPDDAADALATAICCAHSVCQ